MLFSVMLLAHLLADYPFQPDWLVARKNQWPWLLAHGVVVFVTMVLMLLPFLPTLWSLLLLISGVHTLQDWFKLRVRSSVYGTPLIPYFIDQGFHLLLLATCASLSDIRPLIPPLPQAIYLLGIGLVLVGWAFPITIRVARVRVGSKISDKNSSQQ